MEMEVFPDRSIRYQISSFNEFPAKKNGKGVKGRLERPLRAREKLIYVYARAEPATAPAYGSVLSMRYRPYQARKKAYFQSACLLQSTNIWD